jgi:hypothetical protein
MTQMRLDEVHSLALRISRCLITVKRYGNFSDRDLGGRTFFGKPTRCTHFRFWFGVILPSLGGHEREIFSQARHGYVPPNRVHRRAEFPRKLFKCITSALLRLAQSTLPSATFVA